MAPLADCDAILEMTAEVGTRQLESYKGIQIYAAYNPTPSLLL
jgi:hypothetical protein